MPLGSDGRKWYEETSAKAASAAAPTDRLALVYKGLPNPAAVVDYYAKHGEKNYGKLVRDPILNTHSFAGIKSTKLDGSITLVFSNDKNAKSIAKTPLMVNSFIKLGELCPSRGGIILLNGEICRDDSCRAINGEHLPSCREGEVVDQMRAAVAIKASTFVDLLKTQGT